MTLRESIWPLAAAASFALLVVLEQALPLRPVRSRKSTRVIRNLSLGAISFGILAIVQTPLVEDLARGAQARGLGALNVPRPLLVVLELLFLDYTLWIWHWLNHKVPLLWRFHLVHHVDRDLDASTGLRFHFGEMTLSIGFRLLQVAIVGGDLAVVGAWQGVLLSSVLFQHSNVRLPARLDRALTWVMVTPRMHGIHHSDVRAETDSNWSSLLTVWDRLHCTLRLDVPVEKIRIGVPAYSTEDDVGFARMLTLPFGRQRRDWVDPGGEVRERREA
jgi:sterol desaturase/sphingolipid hydroxylase (fatty acid hydroxylase superfamily)